MRLLIAGIIIFLHIVLLLSDLAEAVPRNSRSVHFSILCSHTADTTVLKREFRKIPFLLSGLQSHTDTELNWMYICQPTENLSYFTMMICHVSADARKQLRSLPSKELQRCRLQDTTETIPLFSEVLSLVDGQVPLLIELKIPKSSLSICEKTWEALKNYNGPYMVQSFQHTWHLVVPPPCATCPERSAFFQSDCRQSSGTMDTDFYCKTSARQCTRTS